MSSVMAEVLAEVAECDLACSRFRDDSELMRLNDPGRRRLAVAVSPWLADALRTALVAARDTDGLVDPTVGQCLIDLGYDRSFELLTPDQPLVVRATHAPAWEHVSVRMLEARVPLAASPRPGRYRESSVRRPGGPAGQHRHWLRRPGQPRRRHCRGRSGPRGRLGRPGHRPRRR